MTPIAQQVKEAAIAALREALPDVDIRGILDLSGAERGMEDIVVAADDAGNYGGMPNRVLVTVNLRAYVSTHLEGDMDGSGLCTLLAAALDALARLDLSGLRGYAVSLPGGYILQGVTSESMGGSYRTSVISATVQLHAVPVEDESESNGGGGSDSASAEDSDSRSN